MRGKNVSVFNGTNGTRWSGENQSTFEFVKNNAEKMNSYSMEEAIFQRVMSIGRTAMKSYFAVKGTGDVGDILVLEDGRVEGSLQFP